MISTEMLYDPMPRVSRRAALKAAAGAGLAALAGATTGCERAARADVGKLELVWGERGNEDGYLQKPRAATVDSQDRLYLSDLTDRIQVFSTDGEFIRAWRLPDFNVDGPTGLSIASDGNLLVGDTHFNRVLVYTPDGELLLKFGGTQGTAPGEFGYLRDVVEGPDGNLYTCEGGDFDRVQVFSRDGKFLRMFGSHGTDPGQFMRPEGMVFDSKGRLFIADSCNHRVQTFDPSGKLLAVWGEFGHDVGQLCYPYDIAIGRDDSLYVIEFGNHRVQKFRPDGKSLGTWGRAGRKPGELNNPWALAMDRHERVHVIDSLNHRVQRIVM